MAIDPPRALALNSLEISCPGRHRMLRLPLPSGKPRRALEAEIGRAVVIRNGSAFAASGPISGAAKLHEFACMEDVDLHLWDLKDALASHASALGLDTHFEFGGVLVVTGFPHAMPIDGIVVQQRLTMRVEQQTGVLGSATYLVARADNRWIVDGSLADDRLAKTSPGETAVRLKGDGPARGRIATVSAEGVVLLANGEPRVYPASNYSVAARSSYVRANFGPVTLRRLQVASGSLTASGNKNRYAVKDRFATAGRLVEQLGASFTLATGETATIASDWVEVRIEEVIDAA